MKNKFAKKILRFLLLGTVCIGSLVFVGCRHKNIRSTSEATRVMKEKLYEKYNKDFVVSEAKKVSGSSNGVPASGDYSYCVDAYQDDKTQTFTVSIGKDGNNFADDYCKILLEEPLREYIYDLLAEVENVEVKNYNAIFFCETGCWNEEDVIEEFLKLTKTYINLEIEVTAASVDDAASTCYEAYRVLADHYAKPCIKFVYEGQSINVTNAYEGSSEDEIIESIKRKLSN